MVRCNRQRFRPFLVLGTTFGSRLLGMAYGFGGLREGMKLAAGSRTHLTKPN